MAKPTRLDDCQYLLRSPLNYTLTHFADHSDRFTHDMLNRYLRGDRVSPCVITGIGAPIKRSTSLRNAESLICLGHKTTDFRAGTGAPLLRR